MSFRGTFCGGATMAAFFGSGGGNRGAGGRSPTSGAGGRAPRSTWLIAPMDSNGCGSYLLPQPPMAGTRSDCDRDGKEAGIQTPWGGWIPFLSIAECAHLFARSSPPTTCCSSAVVGVVLYLLRSGRLQIPCQHSRLC